MSWVHARYFLAILFAAPLITSFCVADDASRFDPRIIHGEPVSVRSIPVAKIIGNDTQGQYICSGALIAPAVVLTASHCVADRASHMTVYVRGSARSVSRFRVHPGARETNDGFILNDVALLFLRRSVSGTTLPIIQAHTAAAGDGLDIYGFGTDDNGRTGVLRKGSMVVDSVDSYYVYARYDGSLSNTCDGDSGGPALTTYVNSQGQTVTGIVAITSGGELEDCGPGDLSYFSTMQNASTKKFLRNNVPGIRFK